MDCRTIVLLPRHRVAIGQGVGAGDVQMILKADEVGRLVRLEQGVERDIGGDAGGTLRPVKSSIKTTWSALLVLPSGISRRFKRGNLAGDTLRRAVALSLAWRASLSLASSSMPVARAPPSKQLDHGRLGLECFFAQALVGFLRQLDRQFGVCSCSTRWP